jgi:mannose-6-phosphate isomerase
MFYPLKFKPVYKDYIWGGRNLQKLGKELPEGITAESWEVSCHPDGVSVVANGVFEGIALPALIKKYRRRLLGNSLPEKDITKFPLLVKFIDANDNLSVQVHPDDEYARVHENGEYGKNEMWYILYADPGAKLIYDVIPGTTKDIFARTVKSNNIQNCLNSIHVFPGDVINIPAGLVHAIGRGIVLAEIQQNSNTTYRVYDYDRVDKNGNKRPLHIEKALEAIDFNTSERKEKYKGLEIRANEYATLRYLAANRYFSVELLDVDGMMEENSNGSKFYIYTFIEGSGEINYGTGSIDIKYGESVLIPASLGNYTLNGNLKALKAYVPELENDVINPLKEYGYSEKEIYENIPIEHINT